jgi:hypothetical protein
MSPVQVAGLEVLMIMEQLSESRKASEQLRLQLMDRDPAQVQQWFPEWFETKTVKVTTTQEADSLITYEMGGGSLGEDPCGVDETEDRGGVCTGEHSGR